MKFNILINQVKANEWGLNLSQAVLFAFCWELSSWADRVFIGNQIYYFASRNMIIKEMPLLGDKPDTIYRLLKQLEEKGLILVKKQGKKDLVVLTSITRDWNSEKNPNLESYPILSGNISENDTENFPTNKSTKREKKIKDNGRTPEELIRKKKIDFCLKVLEWDKENHGKYPKSIYVDFTKRWLELATNGKKMRFEEERFFELGLRLSTWFKRAKDWEISKAWEAEAGTEPLNILLRKLF